MNIDWTKYYRYDEIRDILNGLASEHPDLAKVYSIGKSGEGRDLLMIEITNQATGEGSTKPGVYMDGNTHAGEVTGSACCLYTAWYLLSNYASDERVKGLVDTRVWYILPRITVDGSEVYLTTPEMLRSAPRMYPEPEEKDGLYPADVNGDGMILMMRVPDPNGEWKISDKDPRQMVKRAPNESGGQYYRIYGEGLVRNQDGELKHAPRKWGLDFNRNYPGNWALQHRQAGAGRYPFSEPEVRAVGQFYLSHPNIVTGMAFHTSGGCLLRPFATMGDDKMPRLDLAAYKAIGELGTKVTGYPTWGVWDGFTADKNGAYPVGSDLEWVYEHLGVLAWETELWDIQSRAGIPKRTYAQQHNLSDKEREEDELKLLAWNDQELGGKGFINWTPFDHPTFGKVEIGGWNPKFVRQNPPPHLLPDEVERANAFSLIRGETTPLLRIKETGVEDLGGGLYRVTAWAQNQGYLPTNVTEMALRVKQAKPVVAELSGEGIEFVMGKAKEDIGHIEGRASGGYVPARTEKRVQWVIKAKPGTCITVAVSSPRAGRDSRQVTLA
ncbi:MAG: M14 family metallopeptidase [Chloroflexota bacterium]